MKKTAFAAALILLLSFAGIHAMNKRNSEPKPDGKNDIAGLWKEYESASSADKPQKQLEILEEIKKAALKQRLPWDFYKAGRNFVDVSLRRNWKLRDSLDRQFQNEIKEFDEPILTFYYGKDDGIDGKKEFIAANRRALEAGRNSEFYSEDSHIRSSVFGAVLPDLIQNDYQYALWSMALASAHNNELFEDFRSPLSDVTGSQYPASALLELTPVLRMEEWNKEERPRKKESLEKFADKYMTQAVSLFARQELLKMKNDDLLSDSGSTSEQYQELRSEAGTFEKDRKAFAGKEKAIAECCSKRVAALIKELDSKDVFFSIEDGVIIASLRNLDAADVTVKEKEKTVFKSELKNTVKSYYVLDTVRLVLPDFNDGEYTVSCGKGKVESVQDYQKFSLSMAQIQDSKGYAIYLADALSGKPVSKADVSLMDDSGKTVAECKGLNLNGFTYLPESITKHLNKDIWRNYIKCSYTDENGFLRMTRDGRLGSRGTYDLEGKKESTYVSIFTDRSSFNPGDTVQYKIIVYQGDHTEHLNTVPSGKSYTVKLTDAQGKEISSQTVTTGEFGSAAGGFLLERRERNGRYRLSVYDKSVSIASTSITVDDFVLPSFDLVFDKCDKMFFSGDDIDVSGTVRSYSGHSLSSADISYVISWAYSDAAIETGSIKAGTDGKFNFSFKAGKFQGWGAYMVTVKVTDATGETLEWKTYRVLADRVIPFYARLLDTADSVHEDMKGAETDRRNYSGKYIVSHDLFKIRIETRMQEYYGETDLTRSSLKISYTLKCDDVIVSSGEAKPGETLSLDTSVHPSGLYSFEAKASDTDIYGNLHEDVCRYDIIKLKDDDTSLNFDIENIFKVIEGDDIAVQIGSTNGPVWACVDIYGRGGVRLGSKMVYLDGKKGENGSLCTVNFGWKPEWPNAISLHAFYFKDYERHSYAHDYQLYTKSLDLPLSFTRFHDKTSPASTYSFEISTKPGVECLASVFDKSTEKIQANRWFPVTLYNSGGSDVYYLFTTGANSSLGMRMMVNGAVMMSKAARADVYAAAPDADMGIEIMDYAEEEAVEEAIAFQLAGPNEDDGMHIRENFANTIAFEPFLRSDAQGKIEFNITTADKLSTYYVQLFAHNKEMNNSALRQEMMVTIPVKVSVVEPQFLYTGDRYVVKAALSSGMESPVKGWLKADFYNGKDYRNTEPFKSLVKEVELNALQTLSEGFEITVPEINELGIKLTFIADGASGSDAVFVSVPVYPAVQTLTEAHSAVLHNGESLESLLSELKSQFVNTSASDAEVKTVSVIDMVREAVPSKVEASSSNVISLSEALYVRKLAEKLGSDLAVTVSDTELVNKIMACRRSDGGFSWFEGMESSPVVTATLLQRYAGLRRRGLIDPQNCGISMQTVKEAVLYLDKTYFGTDSRPLWRGGISYEQYVSTRAMFPEVAFSEAGTDSKVLKEFRKETKEYLTPKKERGLEGYILGKARRMRILLELSGSEDGKELAEKWGVSLGTRKKLLSSLEKDLESIVEYAVEHRSGGYYYPNAVMPFRGLLESEAYAHAFIADLLCECSDALAGKANDSDLDKVLAISDGIRLWLMLQKETQKWDEEPAFVDALSSIMDASENVLKLKVVSVLKTFTKPLSQIKSSGNGFTISRKFYLVKADGSKVALDNGDKLKVGDKVLAEYHIWNEENRSFVRITAPRMASLRPMNQLSGMSSMPYGYRNVLNDRTEYWFDSYPEENTAITEEFFVTQEGTFQTAAVEVESLYAPHYRANDGAHPAIASE